MDKSHILILPIILEWGIYILAQLPLWFSGEIIREA